MGFLALAGLSSTLATLTFLITIITVVRRATSSIRTRRKVLCNQLSFFEFFHFLLDFHFAYSLKDFRHTPFSIILHFHIPCSPHRHLHHRWLLQDNQQHKSLQEGSLQSFGPFETLSLFTSLCFRLLSQSFSASAIIFFEEFCF